MLRSNMLGNPEPHFWELAVLDKNNSRMKEMLMKEQHIPEKRQQLDELNQVVKDMNDFIQEYETIGMVIYEGFTK